MSRIAVLVVLLASQPLLAKEEWSHRTPAGSLREVRLRVAGKELTYAGFDAATPAHVNVSGPTRLRVLVRYEFAADDPPEPIFHVLVDIDGARESIRLRKTKRSTKTTYVGVADRTPSIRHELFIDVPSGSHSISVRLQETGRCAAASFYVKKGKKGYTRVSMSPVEYARTSVEVYKEKERTWYVGDREKAVALDVIGPTHLTVLTSLDFQPSLRGPQTYTVVAAIDGAVAGEFPLASERSEVRSWRDREDVVPGVLKEFALGVPEGSHRVTFLLKGTESLGAAFRFLIPAKDAAR